MREEPFSSRRRMNVCFLEKTSVRRTVWSWGPSHGYYKHYAVSRPNQGANAEFGPKRAASQANWLTIKLRVPSWRSFWLEDWNPGAIQMGVAAIRFRCLKSPGEVPKQDRRGRPGQSGPAAPAPVPQIPWQPRAG